MMIRALTLAAGLAAASTAHAGFVGWDMRVDAQATADAQALGGELASAVVYRMYAVFDNGGNIVLNVFNADFSTTDGSTLYQDGFGNNFAPQSSFIGLVPSLAFDSFVTLNELADNTSTSADPDFAFTSNGVNGGWFNSNPPNDLGASVQNGSVWETLVGQFTIVPGAGTRDLPGPTSNADGMWFGLASITFDDGVSEDPIQLANQGFIPTPGAMALFGLAGLTAARRRRSA